MINTVSINDFIQSIGKQTPNVLDERIEFGAIQMDPLMATVWTPYTFYFKGGFSISIQRLLEKQKTQCRLLAARCALYHTSKY